jgi:hypothetical protein
MAAGCVALALTARQSPAQTCTTQAKMPAATRQALADRAQMLASAVKAGDSSAIKAVTVAAYANNFAAAQYAIQNTTDKLGGDSLHVADVFLLDASALKAGAEADFICALTGSASEVDFSITGLDPGVYGFAMVEAPGDRPWLLSFLLRQDGVAGPSASGWKMAGFYPHARTAAGRDGLWYWTDARAKVAAKQPWLAWLEYGQADSLLSPAVFFSSTNLDKLRTERRLAAPAAVADGLSVEQPLLIKSAAGEQFRFTSIASEGADDGQAVRLVLHYAAGGSAASGSASSGSAGGGQADARRAAQALLAAHPELRQAYPTLLVFGDVPDQNPVVFSGSTAEIAP